MSVISVKINEDEEIEYVNLESETRQQRKDDGDHDDDNADAAAVEHDGDQHVSEEHEADDDDDDDDDEQQHDDDGDDADVIDHDPGAELDAAMANQTDDDDDELNTVLVPNSDGSMTIQRKAKAIIEHMCGKCNKSYKSMASLKRHLNLCRHVPKNAAVAQRMKKEMKRSVTSTSLDDVRPNECFCCFEDKASAHVGFIACNFCPKTFKSHINLERHLFTLHAPSAEFACTVCNAQCASETIYNLHVESHGEGKPFACGKCGKEFTRKYHLDRHLEYTECDPNRPKQKLPCNVCSKEFTRLDNLREHLRSHMGQAQRRKDYQCPYCEKSFYGSSLLNIHIRTHTGERPFPCDLCTCWFPSNGALRKHRRTHTGEKPYECSVCAKCFSVKETLNRHMKIHTGDRKHACPHCEKTFIQAQQLKAHLFYHTGENGFECEQCPQRFNKRSRLELHIRTVHLNANQLTCDVCQEKFRFKGRLAKHLREHIKEAKTASPTPTVVKKQSKAASAALNVKKEEEPAEGDEQQRMETVLEIEEMIVPDVIAPDVDVAPVMISRAAKRTADRRGDADEVASPRPKRLAAAAAAVKVKREEEDQDHDHESIPKKTIKATATTTRNSTATSQSPNSNAKTPPSANKSPSAFPYPCDHCDRVFSRKGPLAMHLKSHKRAESDSASAAGRLSSFSPSAASPETRPTVRKSPPSASTASGSSPKAAAKKTVTCKVCKKQLNNLDALVKHMKLNHRKLYMLMFADDDGDDDDDDNNDDDNNDDAGDVNEDDGAAEQEEEENNGDDGIDDDAPTKPSVSNHEDAKADDDGDEAEEYEIEVIHMKDEDDDVEPQIVVNRKRSAASIAELTVDALPTDGLTADQLTDKIGKLLELLVDEQTLAELGWPAAQCELVLERVIEQCGQTPADPDTCPDYATVLRENAKLLFTSVLSNDSIKELLNNHTVDEVIVHVLKLAS